MPTIGKMMKEVVKRLKGEWTLKEAMPLILQLQTVTRDLGYHVALGGGVLNKGRSNKDLDLYVLPLNDMDATGYDAVRNEIRKILTYVGEIKSDPDYAGHRKKYENAAFDEASIYEWKGKRVDVFIVTCRASLVANRLLSQ